MNARGSCTSEKGDLWHSVYQLEYQSHAGMMFDQMSEHLVAQSNGHKKLTIAVRHFFNSEKIGYSNFNLRSSIGLTVESLLKTIEAATVLDIRDLENRYDL